MNDFERLKTEIEVSPQYKGIVCLNEPIAPKTTFKIGGNAKIYFEPEDTASLAFLIKTLGKKKIPHFILGHGSNVVVSDDGFDEAVICTTRISFVETSGALSAGQAQKMPLAVDITCGAGTSIAAFIQFCKSNAISGGEEFAGLPGSIGGAVYMNARCFGKSISDILKSVLFLDVRTMRTETYPFSAADWDYKQSPFQGNDRIIVSATLSLMVNNAEKEKISKKCLDYINQRVKKRHFDFPSAGSVFKNNRNFGSPSGKLIDECNLCGTKIGGAQIAPWHGNFIINTGNATEKDVRALVNLTIHEVKSKKGLELSPEIIFCGKHEEHEE